MQDKIKQQLGEMIFNADYSDTDNIISFMDQNFIGKEEVKKSIELQKRVYRKFHTGDSKEFVNGYLEGLNKLLELLK